MAWTIGAFSWDLQPIGAALRSKGVQLTTTVGGGYRRATINLGFAKHGMNPKEMTVDTEETKSRPLAGARYSRAFYALLVAQVISLMGDRIVAFALPLYVLDITGSATLFSTVTACALVPYILLTPLGGVVADRVDKRHLMACLDLALVAICVVFLWVEGCVDLAVLSMAAMVGLYAVQAFYAPTVQASVPRIVARDGIVTATAVINQVSSLAGLVGPFAAGMLYGFFGLTPILVVGAVAFAVSSVLVASLVHVPRLAREASSGSPLAIVASDLKEGLRSILSRPVVRSTLLFVMALNAVMSAFVSVSMPVLVTQVLELPSQYLGVAEAVTMMGGFAGAGCVAVLGSRLRFARAGRFVLVAGAFFGAMALVLGLLAGQMATFVGVVVCLFGVLGCAQAFSVQAISYVQLTTPEHLIGKVVAILTAGCMVAMPVGQLVWGVAFDVARNSASLLALGVAVVTVVMGWGLGRALKAA